VTRKKRKRGFSPAKQAKRRSRETLGTPPPTRVEADRRRKPLKHKKKLLEEAE
jgi:hypothetical protein